MSAAAFDLSIYGILDPTRSLGRNLAELSRDAVAGGVTFLQLRDKHGSTRRMIEAARTILEQTQGRCVPLVINDRVDVALASGADGVHVGADDMAPEDARRLLGPEAIIGVTIHSIEEAANAPVEIADYYGVGGVYATASKDNPNPPIGIDGFAEIARALKARHENCSIVGIAGIDAANAAPVIGAGANGVAVISSLFMQPDVIASTAHLSKVVTEAQGRMS